MESILENISDACIALDDQWRLTYLNRAAVRSFRRSRDELLGRDFASCLPVIALPRVMEQLGRAWREQTAVEFDEHFADLGACHVRVQVEQARLYVFFQACNDERWAQEELRLREERYRVLVEATSANVWRTDPQGMIIDELPSLGAFTGFSFEQYRGWGWKQMIHPDDLPELLMHWQAAVASKTVYQFEFRLIRHDGQYRYVLAKGVPLVDEQGNVREWTGACTDVDDFKRLQDERSRLLESERAARAEAERAGRMKDEFLATLSHELRTPLNAILGWSHLLKMGQLSDEQFERGLDTIQRNARVQTQLIEDLLDMSRIISGKLRLQLQQVDPKQVVGAAVAAVAAAAADKAIQLRVTTDASALSVWGDPARLEQVVWNLLSNAVKFTPEGGQVEVSVSRTGEQVQLRVGDSGRGIARQFLPFVFDRFRQADASTSRYFGGLGLGLAIVKHLVELHGGSVSAESVGEGQGAAFSVSLPVADPNAMPQPGPPGHARPQATGPGSVREIDLAGLTVLVVDDEPDARDLARRVLEQFGAQVNTAASAAEGLELLAQHRPDVLVSDIGMPGTDGYAFMRQAQSQDSSGAAPLAAIALTAFARVEDQQRAAEAGYRAHLSKPVDPWDLAAAVSLLSGRPPG